MATRKARKRRVPKRSAMLEAIHEAASDLYRIGLADDRTMREFDRLCGRRTVPNEKTQQAIEDSYAGRVQSHGSVDTAFADLDQELRPED